MKEIDFSQFTTEKELKNATGLTPEQALRIINHKIDELKGKRK